MQAAQEIQDTRSEREKLIFPALDLSDTGLTALEQRIEAAHNEIHDLCN